MNDEELKNMHEDDPEVAALLNALASDLESDCDTKRDLYIRRFEEARTNPHRAKKKRVRQAGDSAPTRVFPARRFLAVAAVLLLVIMGAWFYMENRSEKSFGELMYSENLSAGKRGPLNPHDTIKTAAKGRAGVWMDAGRIEVMMNEDTEVVCEARDWLALKGGDIWVEVQPNSGYFRVSTPHGEVEVTGTSFGVTTIGDSTRVNLLHGSVNVRSSGSELTLSPGMGVTIATNRAKPVPEKTGETEQPNWARDLMLEIIKASSRDLFPSVVPDKDGQVEFK